MNAQEIIKLLGLVRHREGGFFKETYRSPEPIDRFTLPERYGGGERTFSTAIYYLLTPEANSALHRVKSDELFHFYLGDPVEQLVLMPDGPSITRTLGTDLANGQLPQAVVPRMWWQGARLAAGGRFALLGATVAPSFDYADYEEPDSVDGLKDLYPDAAYMIEALKPVKVI